MISTEFSKIAITIKNNIALAPSIVLIYGVFSVIFAAISTDVRIIYLFSYKDFMLNAIYVIAFSLFFAGALFPLNYLFSRKIFFIELKIGLTIIYSVVSIVIFLYLFSSEFQILNKKIEYFGTLIGGLMLIFLIFGHTSYFVKTQLYIIYWFFLVALTDVNRDERNYTYSDELCMEQCHAVFVSRVLTNYLIYYKEGDQRMAFVPMSDVKSFKFQKGATQRITD